MRIQKIGYSRIVGASCILLITILNPLVVNQLVIKFIGRTLFCDKIVDIIVFDISLLILGCILIFKIFLFRLISRLEILKNILIFISAIIFILLIIGLASYLFDFFNQHFISPKTEYYQTRYDDFWDTNPLLGYCGRSNKIKNIQKWYANGTFIYNVTYTLDQFGRRKSKKGFSNRHLIIFGDSWAFGEGLEDNETLSYYLSELTNYNTYNYNLPGYGTQQMLANLERSDFSKEIPENEGIAIYVFIPNHIRRVIGDFKVYNTWGACMPYYYLDKNDQLRRKGSFTSGRLITSIVYRVVWRLHFLKYFNINFPVSNYKKDTYLTFRVIKRSKEIYESLFNGTFYVLIYSRNTEESEYLTETEESEYLIELLKENNINLLYNPIENYSQYTIPGDGHPTSELNSLLVNKLVNDLNITTVSIE